jgi:hypothetical protein
VLVPVAHPSLDVAAIEDSAQWRRQVLIDYDDTSRPFMQWKSWLRGTGYKEGIAAGGRLLFNQYDQVVQAALAGRDRSRVLATPAQRCGSPGAGGSAGLDHGGGCDDQRRGGRGVSGGCWPAADMQNQRRSKRVAPSRILANEAAKSC